MRLTTLPFLLLAFATSAFSANERPNIVLFLADDLGWTGLSSFGSDFYETPNLDRLVTKGVKFTNAYAACTVCSPTRASIMTGMYPAKLRVTNFIPGQYRPFAKTTVPEWTKGLNKSHTTIAEALKGGGYRTIHVGKWHLDFPNQPNQGPTAHGFDVSHDKPKGTRGYFIKDETVQDLGLKTNYTTDYLTDKAIEEIDRSKEDPFFLYFAYNVPHTPIQGREDLVAYFEKKVDSNATHNNPTYAAMVKSLDLSVGRVLDHLDAKGLSENTLIVFTSDNGVLTQRYGKHDEFTENLPLRRGKGSAYEGGVRVPAIAYWPGATQPGTVSETPIMTTDYYPTFLAAAGVKGDQSHNAAMDGENLIPVFKNASRSLDRNLFWHFPHYHAGGDGPYSSIRSGDWRLVEFHEDGQLELYRIGDDIGESTDLAASHPKKRAQLQAELLKWRRSIAAQMPTPNSNYDPAKATEVAKQN